MPTLTTYRQRIGQVLGQYLSSSAGSSSTTSVLADPNWPVYSSVASAELYRDWFLLRPAASASDKVRLVATYNPSSGQLTPDLVWSAAPTNGESYELHGLIEPNKAMLDIINEALKHCYVVSEFSLTPTPINTRESLATVAPWLNQPQWVRQVGVLAAGETRDQVDPYQRVIRGQAVQDGATIYLTHPGITFASTDTVYVRAIKPAYYDCKPNGGNFGDQNGLSLETDSAPVVEEWVAAAALIQAWREFAQILEPVANQRLIKDRQEAAAWFTQETEHNFHLPPLTFRPLQLWGPLPTVPYSGSFW